MVACDTNTLVSDQRDPLVGNWTCRETAGQSYQVTVSKAPLEDDKMYFNNLYNLNEDVEVTISGSNLSIPGQDVANFEISGSGSVSSNKQVISLNFTADSNSVQATMTKN